MTLQNLSLEPKRREYLVCLKWSDLKNSVISDFISYCTNYNTTTTTATKDSLKQKARSKGYCYSFTVLHFMICNKLN